MSNRWCEMVEKFRTVFEKPCNHFEDSDEMELIRLRMGLIQEESGETTDALHELYKVHHALSTAQNDAKYFSECRKERKEARIAVLDGICDSIFVLIGTAQALGMDIEKAMEAVFWSNMTKLGEDGKPIYRLSDGKVLKGPNFAPPDLEDFV